MRSYIPGRRELQRQFWLLVRAGLAKKRAAVALGLNADTGKAWFRQAGGVVPAFVTAPSSGRFLSFAEREEIFAGVERDEPIRRIAQRLGRAPSTVHRELLRNLRHPYRPRSRPDRRPGPWDYRPSRAHCRAERLATRPKPA